MRSVAWPDGIGNSSPLDSTATRRGLEGRDEIGFPSRAFLWRRSSSKEFSTPLFGPTACLSISSNDCLLPPIFSIIDINLSNRASMARGSDLVSSEEPVCRKWPYIVWSSSTSSSHVRGVARRRFTPWPDRPDESAPFALSRFSDETSYTHWAPVLIQFPHTGWTWKFPLSYDGDCAWLELENLPCHT